MAAIVSKSCPEAANYFFHLDVQPERVRFSSRMELTGWLFHRRGAAFHGLRAVVRSPLRFARIYPARRKRSRPVIGAAYPELPEATTSGFLIELDRLPFGACTLELQVKDNERKWRCIYKSRLTN